MHVLMYLMTNQLDFIFVKRLVRYLLLAFRKTATAAHLPRISLVHHVRDSGFPLDVYWVSLFEYLSISCMQFSCSSRPWCGLALAMHYYKRTAGEKPEPSTHPPSLRQIIYSAATFHVMQLQCIEICIEF